MTQAPSILVAGGQGRLGRALGELGCTAPGRSDLDITDPGSIRSVLERAKPAAVINAAAFTNVDAAESEKDRARQINADGAGNVARFCADASVPLVHVSTDLVFSQGDPAVPIDEDCLTQPASIYGETKLQGELQVQAAGGRHVITRVSWLFGELSESFISKIMALAVGRERLQLVSDEFGRPTTFGALARKLLQLAVLVASDAEVPHVLHLGSPHPVNRLQWAEQIFARSSELGGPSPRLEPVLGSHFKTPARRANGVILDVRRADALLGPMPDWRPASNTAVDAILQAAADGR